MGFTPAVPDVRQQVRNDVVDSPDVSERQAAVGLQDDVRKVARGSQIGRGGRGGSSLRRPSYAATRWPTCWLPAPRYTRELLALGVVTAPAFDPYAYHHPQEFQQVVDSGVSVLADNARFRNTCSPSLPGHQTVPPTMPKEHASDQQSLVG